MRKVFLCCDNDTLKINKKNNINITITIIFNNIIFFILSLAKFSSGKNHIARGCLPPAGIVLQKVFVQFSPPQLVSIHYSEHTWRPFISSGPGCAAGA
jgi:hypothetical protein